MQKDSRRGPLSSRHDQYRECCFDYRELQLRGMLAVSSGPPAAEAVEGEGQVDGYAVSVPARTEVPQHSGKGGPLE